MTRSYVLQHFWNTNQNHNDPKGVLYVLIVKKGLSNGGNFLPLNKLFFEFAVTDLMII